MVKYISYRFIKEIVMGQCARCSVANLIHKYGKDNVIEIESYSESSSTHKLYNIYVKDNNTTKRDALIIKNNKYRWLMGCYSLEHSLDEDCAASFNSKYKFSGYPARVDIEELDICKINI